jgi:hypothetical protein
MLCLKNWTRRGGMNGNVMTSWSTLAHLAHSRVGRWIGNSNKGSGFAGSNLGWTGAF